MGAGALPREPHPAPYRPLRAAARPACAPGSAAPAAGRCRRPARACTLPAGTTPPRPPCTPCPPPAAAARGRPSHSRWARWRARCGGGTARPACEPRSGRGRDDSGSGSGAGTLAWKWVLLPFICRLPPPTPSGDAGATSGRCCPPSKAGLLRPLPAGGPQRAPRPCARARPLPGVWQGSWAHEGSGGWKRAKGLNIHAAESRVEGAGPQLPSFPAHPVRRVGTVGMQACPPGQPQRTQPQLEVREGPEPSAAGARRTARVQGGQGSRPLRLRL